MSTDICPTKNWQLLFILTLWSYSKCKDILQMYNVSRSTEKEHQVTYHWDPDEISIS